MARIVNDQRHAAEDLEKFIKLDQAFHIALAKATGNDILLSIVERINDILSVCRAKYSQSPKRITHSIKGHASILDGVSIGDPDLASQTMYQHIE